MSVHLAIYPSPSAHALAPSAAAAAAASAIGCATFSHSLLPSALPQPRSSSTSPVKAAAAPVDDDDDDEMAADGDEVEEEQFVNESPPHVGRALAGGGGGGRGVMKESLVVVRDPTAASSHAVPAAGGIDDADFERDELDVISPARPAAVALSPGKRDRRRAATDVEHRSELVERRLNTAAAAAASAAIKVTDNDTSRQQSGVSARPTTTSRSTSEIRASVSLSHSLSKSAATSTSTSSLSERKAAKPLAGKLPMGGWKVATPQKQGDLFFDLGSGSGVAATTTSLNADRLRAKTTPRQQAPQDLSIFGIAPGVAAKADGAGERAADETMTAGSRGKSAAEAIAVPAANAMDKKRKHADRDVESGAARATAAPTASQVKRRKASGKDVADYRAKYLRAFPNFVFHFDLEADASVVRSLRECVKKLGGRVEEFLSKKVTHVISHRAPGGQSGADSKSKALTPKDVNNNVSRGKTGAAARSADLFKKPDLPAKLDVAASVVAHDELISETVRTALTLKIKVWSTSKLRDVLDILLAGSGAPAKAPSRLNDLTFLLEDEKINGTRERDATAPRADYYYFAPDSVHLLIEDAAGEHRPIMAKQYEKPRAGSSGDPWPVLHESFLRPSEASKANRIPAFEQRDRVWTLYVRQAEWGAEFAPLRSEDEMSDEDAPRNLDVPGVCDNRTADTALPYQAASGNSVVLTSNIASTTSNTRSGGINSGTPNGLNFGGLLSGSRDRRLVQMSKRVQLLKAKADPAVLAAERKKQALLDTVADECPAEADWDEELEAGEEEASVFAPPEPEVPRMTAFDDTGNEYGDLYDDLRLKCLRVLQNAKAPLAVPPEYRRALRKMRAGVSVAGTTRESKGGYCENCRIKFDDFEVHINGKRHRRFARDDKNFEKLDELLERLRRPLRRSIEEDDEMLGLED